MTTMPEEIRKNIIEMLEARGYTVRSETDDHLIAANIFMSGGKKVKRSVCVFKSIYPKINVEVLKVYMKNLHDMGLKHCICVCKIGITSKPNELIKKQTVLKVEVFNERELMFNPTKHVLVPKHTALCKDESRVFKEKYGTKCPIILKSDCICRFYDFNRGDIIRVERKDGYISYRIVK